MSRGAVLAVPAFAPGLGGGHLVRCMALVRDLRALGREAALFLPNSADGSRPLGLFESAHFDPAWIMDEDGLHEKNWECIIADRFRTPREEYLRWAKLAPVIAIDEGGSCRKDFDFLIDILPNLSRMQPNVSSPSLLPLPKKIAPRKNHADVPRKVLISFGQEDSAGLGSAAAEALAAQSNGCLEITLLKGALANGRAASGEKAQTQNIRVMEKIPNLAERLGEHDLIVTHLGLTAFEALYAGVPVLLLSPTGLHEKTARRAGFCSAGIGRGRAKKLAKMLVAKGAANRAFFSKLKNQCKALAKRHNVDRAPQQNLAELINGFTPDLSSNCAACGSALLAPPLARFPERAYRRCKRCGVISMNRLTPPPIEYAREYFFEFYQKQYGKTYIEDFPNLVAMGKQRLAAIKSMLPNASSAGSAPLLLDIGCAYGPFLVAAKAEGFSPFGIDPAEDAVSYVTQTLGIPAKQGFFQKGLFGADKYDAISLWYVIEHFRDCVEVLAEIHKLLKPGGVLAFSTPSFAGISGRSSPRRFLECSPADHWTVWSPAACKKALAAAGFKTKKITVTGHHPERFPFLGKYVHGKKGRLYRLLLAASKAFGLGDTFEVYAIKSRKHFT